MAAKKVKGKDLAELLDIRYTTLRQMNSDRLAQYGWLKHGAGHGCYYTKVGPNTVVAEEELDAELKRTRIRKMNQQIEENKRQIESEYEEKVLSVVNDVLGDLSDKLHELKLSKENIDILSQIINKSIDDIEERRKT